MMDQHTSHVEGGNYEKDKQMRILKPLAEKYQSDNKDKLKDYMVGCTWKV